MRVGSICYATDQGLGHLAKDFFDHGVVTDPVIFAHPHPGRTNHLEWYPPGTPVLNRRPFSSPKNGSVIERWVEAIDVALFFETPFDWDVLEACRDAGVKTVVMAMHEWTLEKRPREPDLWACPSKLDLEYFLPSKRVYLPVPVDQRWRLRTEARTFVHNAGHVGSRNHKGTEELMRAVEWIRNPVELVIRFQDAPMFQNLAASTGWERIKGVSPARVTVEVGNLPRSELFARGEVYVAPEKFNGLSLPLQEAYASGMAVMTTDRFPHNDWLPPGPLIRESGVYNARVAQGYMEFQESIVDPRDVAAKIDEWWGRDVSELSESGRRWAEANSWAALKPEWVAALEKLCGLS